MGKQRVFLTGATGGMGFASLKEMVKDLDKQDIVILARDSEKNRKLLAPYLSAKGLEIVWGDLTDYAAVVECVRGCDLILHIAAFVSPAADYHPKQAMQINYGSTRNLIKAIYELGQQERTRLVYIGTVAETGDRIRQAAQFRGGRLISTFMKKGDWQSKLEFECAFGHRFWASPRLVLEGGHWCDECERKSWNYGRRAKVDPFFAQAWTPLHGEDELREYPKEVSELDV